MIITIISVGVFLISTVIAIYAKVKDGRRMSIWSDIECILACVSTISLCTTIVLCGTIIYSNCFTDEHLSELQEKREALVYQIDHNLFFGDAVGEFNGEIIKCQKLHENPWTNWFYGSYYMEIEPIDLSEGE